MGKYVIDEKTLKGIADAIRSKKGTDETFLTENFASEIEGIGNETLNALIDRSITEINIPEGITSIGQAIFWACQQLKKVNMPDSITSIGSYAFYYCSALEELVFSKNLTGIGSNVFYNCINCKTFDFSRCTSVPKLGANAFTSISADAKIIVPSALYPSWVAANNWEERKNHITSRVIIPYTEEWGGKVRLGDIWVYNGWLSGTSYTFGASPLKAYVNENGSVHEITNNNLLFGNWEFVWTEDESGWIDCCIPSSGLDYAYLGLGTYEIWIENGDGKKIYSRILEVKE